MGNQAIIEAVHSHAVDILVTGVGLDRRDDSVTPVFEAIEIARAHGVLMFAAGEDLRSHQTPTQATHHDDVMTIYASDGYGNAFEGNGPPISGNTSFSTLGVAVQTTAHQRLWSPRSGTFVATTVATAIASILIYFMRQQKSAYLYFMRGSPTFDNAGGSHALEKDLEYERITKKMLTRAGMEAVFRLMAETRDGYNYVAPWKLTKEHGDGINVVFAMLRALKKV
jgi:hypothetical protein